MEEEAILESRLRSRDSVLNEASITKCMQLFTTYTVSLQHKDAYADEATWEKACEKRLEAVLRELTGGFWLFCFAL